MVHAQVFNVEPTLHDFHVNKLAEACAHAAVTPLLSHGLEVGYTHMHTECTQGDTCQCSWRQSLHSHRSAGPSGQWGCAVIPADTETLGGSYLYRHWMF